jgi:hypothetical protein
MTLRSHVFQPDGPGGWVAMRRGDGLPRAATVSAVNGPKSLPATLRVLADNLSTAANDLARVLKSVATALEPAASGKTDSRPPGPPRTARRSPATPGKRTHSPAQAADRTVRAAMLELGPATSAQIAAHINQAAGRRVIDGRTIRGHAQRLGARVVTRRGQRLYRL